MILLPRNCTTFSVQTRPRGVLPSKEGANKTFQKCFLMTKLLLVIRYQFFYNTRTNCLGFEWQLQSIFKLINSVIVELILQNDLLFKTRANDCHGTNNPFLVKWWHNSIDMKNYAQYLIFRGALCNDITIGNCLVKNEVFTFSEYVWS